MKKGQRDPVGRRAARRCWGGVLVFPLLAVTTGAALAAQGNDGAPAFRDVADGPAQVTAFLASEAAVLGRLGELEGRLGLAAHDAPGLAMAFYDPRSAGPPGEASGAASATVSEPRVIVRDDYYLTGEGTLLGAREMAVDVYEYLVHALVLAWFHLESTSASPQVVDPDTSDYLDFVRERAAASMPEAAPETREAQYVTAVAAFASHVLSLRNEVLRAKLRRGGEAQGLCRLLEAGGGLFGLWGRALREERYTGYVIEDAPPLERLDQERFLEAVLQLAWDGDPVADLGPEVCADAAVAPR